MDLTTAGRYELKSPIGRGGMATVYLAHDPRFRRDVAVKIMRDTFDDPLMLARFEREAQTIAALEHPAIVPVYDYGEENGRPYLVMRYMSGGTLADRLGAGPLPVAQVVTILERIGSALERAHALGVIHRDLKPSNIMFDQYGDAFLGDFGIARLTEAAVTLTGEAVIGTPAYMSPEQVHGDKTLDGRSDIYALGVVVFEMLAGRQPYVDESPVKVMMKHVIDPVPTVRSVNPNLPPDFDALIARTMAKNPDERFATARELARALAAAAAEAPAAAEIESAAGAQTEIEISPTSPPSEGAQPVAAEVATVALAPAFTGQPAPAPAATRKRRPSPGVWLALMIGGLPLLLLLLAGGALLVYRSRSAGPDETASAATLPPMVPTPLAAATATRSVVSGEVYLALAREQLDHGAVEEALVALNRAIELEPDNAEYYRQRADAYWHVGDLEAALADADWIVAHSGNDASNYLFRARLLRDYGELGQALRDQTHALALDPDYADAYHERGEIYLWQGAYEAALADLDRAITLDAGNAHHFVLRGIIKREASLLPAAVADHLRAVSLDPGDAYFRAELGISYQWAGDFEKALVEYGEAIRLERESGWYYSLRGTLRRDLGDLDGSLADFNQAIRWEPEDAALYAGRALTHREKGGPDAAVADLTRAIQMAPYEAWFYLERGVIYRDWLEDFPAAEADFFQAIDLVPNEPDPYIHQAATFNRLGRLEEAVGLATQCLEVASEYPWCFFERAWAYAGLGQPAKAVADLKRFLELVPPDECPECQSDARHFIADNP
jgi:tetratricopeptide (TPR) repeat protein/tRNA A-37 threonylcarbamoyl transferase component Bud32